MAGQPFNYIQPAANPFELAAGGMNFATGIRKQQGDAVAAQKKAEQDALFQQEVQSVLANPSADGYARLSTLHPELSEGYKRAFETMDAGRKQASIGDGMKILAALDSGNVDIAKTMLAEKSAALRNSGDETQAKAYDDAAAAIDINPDAARITVGAGLAAIDDKFAERYTTLLKGPAEVVTAEAGATTAAAKANFAESDAALDLEKKGWDIKKLQADIETSKSNSRIYAMNAAIARETNALKRQELVIKMNEAIRNRDQQISDRASEASSTLAGIDMMNDTAERLLKSPGLASALGPVESRLPTLSEDTADAESLIENLGSQAFLTQVSQMKGTGALSDAEGKKIGTALQSLKTNQSEKQFRTNVGIIQEVLASARERTVKKYGVPPPPAPSDAGTADDLDALLNQYAPPGAAP